MFLVVCSCDKLYHNRNRTYMNCINVNRPTSRWNNFEMSHSTYYTSWVTRRCSGKICPTWHSICEIPPSHCHTPLPTLPVPHATPTPQTCGYSTSLLPLLPDHPPHLPCHPPSKRDRQMDKQTDISALYIYRYFRCTKTPDTSHRHSFMRYIVMLRRVRNGILQ